MLAEGSSHLLSPPLPVAAASSPTSPAAATAQITGLRILSTPPVSLSRGFLVKRALLHIRIPSPPSSVAGEARTPGSADVSAHPYMQAAQNAAVANGSTAAGTSMFSPPSISSSRSYTQPLHAGEASNSSSTSPSPTPLLPAAASILLSSLSSTAHASLVGGLSTHITMITPPPHSSSGPLSSSSTSSPSIMHTLSPVLCKTFASARPLHELVTRMRFEYLAFQRLQGDVGKPIALVTHEEEGLALLYDDIGGVTLDSVQYDAASTLGDPLAQGGAAIPLSQAAAAAVSGTGQLSPTSPSARAKTLRPLSFILRCACTVTTALLRLHGQGVIYKALRPSTILYNDDTRRCLLLEYNASSLLQRERAVVEDWSDETDVDVLRYISPEQSGRMNRVLDSRTDVYSLGCVLYFLMVGTAPFTSADPMELIHFHLAKACPDLVQQLQQKHGAATLAAKPQRERDSLQCMSAVITKAVSKQAEDRYQSTAGMLADLDYCLHLLTTSDAPQSLTAPSFSPHLNSRSLTPEPMLPSACPSPSSPILSESSVLSPTSPPSQSSRSLPFRVGRTDVLSQFRISQKLYGREQQVQILLDAFARISEDADPTPSASSFIRTTSAAPPRRAPRPELVLIAGYSGIGKTSVVDEVQKPIVRKRGLFVRGKFDLYKRNTSVLLAMFREVVLQLHTQDSAMWKQRFATALGADAAVLIDVIPELEKLLGPQPAPAPLPPTDSEVRFTRTFLNFVHVLAQPSHPLTIFIDDLQWSDSLSLQLLKALFSQESGHLLLVGAYRDNETSAVHPLMRLIDELRFTDDGASSRIHTITLQPLQLQHVMFLVADTLRCSIDAATELAKLLLTRTQGNPFFISSILQSFHAEGLIPFDYKLGRWVWDIEQLRTADVSDDVVDLLCTQIQKLDTSQQEKMKLAACLGNTFDLHTLAIVAQASEASVTYDLWQINEAGLIVPLHNFHQYELYSTYVCAQNYQQAMLAAQSATTAMPTRSVSSAAACVSVAPSSAEVLPVGGTGASFDAKAVQFRFAHDRIQQAATSLIPLEERPRVHLHIGRLLLQHYPADTLDTYSFDCNCCFQFNQGGAQSLVDDQHELRDIIHLELRAAKRARQQNAYAPALEYLQVARTLLHKLRPLDTQDTASAPSPPTTDAAVEPLTCWQVDYDLSVQLHVQLAEVLLLNAQLEAAEVLATEALVHVHTTFEQVAMLEVKMSSRKSVGDIMGAAELGLECLRRLDYQLASIEEVRALAHDSEKVFEEFNRIVNGAEMVDPYHRVVFNVLLNLTPCAVFVSSPTFFLFSSVAHGMVKWSAEHGVSTSTPFALSTYSHLLWGEQQPHLCYKAGEMAMHLLDRLHAPDSIRGKVQTTYYGCIVFWMEPISVAWNGLYNNAELCEENGDYEFGSYCVPEHDTRVLTNHGFLFLKEIEALIEAGRAVLYACYDTSTQGIVYSPGRLKKDAPQPKRWVDFTHAGTRRLWDATSDDYGATAFADDVEANRLTLRTTPEHEMYVQVCMQGGENDGSAPIPPRKMRALQLAPGYACTCAATGSTCTHSYSQYRMYTGAAAGLQTPADRISLTDSDQQSPVAALGLRSEDELDAFLELFGYWLGDGSMAYESEAHRPMRDTDRVDQRATSANAVSFSACTAGDCDYVRRLLARLHLAEGEHFTSNENDVRLEVRVYDLRWYRFFDDEFGVKHKDSRHSVKREALQGMHHSQRSPRPSRPSSAASTAPSQHSESPSSSPSPASTYDLSGGFTTNFTFTPRGRSTSASSTESFDDARARAAVMPMSPQSCCVLCGGENDLDGDAQSGVWHCAACIADANDFTHDAAAESAGQWSDREVKSEVESDASVDDWPGDWPVEDYERPEKPLIDDDTPVQDEEPRTHDDEEDDPVKSAKWLPDWVLFRLDARQLRLAIEGLRQADDHSAASPAQVQTAAVGGSTMEGTRKICTSSVGFRDQLIHACLHAGYNAYFILNTRADEVRGYRAVPHDRTRRIYTPEEMEAALRVDPTRQFRPLVGDYDSWWVVYSEAVSELLPAQDVRFDGSATQPGDLYDEQRDGRVWCVSVEHSDQLIIVQRAHRNAQGVVTKVGRSMIVGNCRTYGQSLMLADGQPLERVASKQKDMLALFARTGNHYGRQYAQMYRFVVAKLVGEVSLDATSMLVEGDSVQLDVMLEEQKKSKLSMYMFANLTCQTLLAFYTKRWAEGCKIGEEGWQVFLHQGHSGAAGLISNVRMLMYYALILTQSAPCSDADILRSPLPGVELPDSFDGILAFTAQQLRRCEELDVSSTRSKLPDRLSPSSPGRSMQTKSEVHSRLTVQVHDQLHDTVAFILSRVAAIQRHMQLWAHHNPHNFLNKVHLINAERLRVHTFCHPHAARTGPRYDLIPHAVRLYEKAIAMARENGFTQEEALGNELCGKFCVQAGLKREGEAYLRAAYWGWAQYGCVLKQEQFKADFPHLFVHSEGGGSGGVYQMGGGALVPRRKAGSIHGSDELAKLAADTVQPLHVRLGDADLAAGHSMLSPPTSHSSSSSTTLVPQSLHSPLVPSPSGLNLGQVEPVPSSPAAGSAAWDHVDTAAVMKACMAFSVETDLAKLTRSLLWLVIQTAGASRGTLLLKTGDTWAVELAVSVDDKDGTLEARQAADKEKAGSSGTVGSNTAIGGAMPISLFHLVLSTHQSVLLSGIDLKALSSGSAASSPSLPAGLSAAALASDPYLQRHRPKACLCVPILQQAQLTGLLYLSNEHTGDSFTLGHVQILRVLTAQAALSIENARLYARVQERSAELATRATLLQQEMERRVAAQEAMRLAKEAAEKAAETKSAFLSNMSHEIRTPMNAVLGLSRLLQDTELSAEQQSYLTMIANSGKLLLTIINDVLDFSRIETNNLELEYRRFALLDCVENATHLCFDMALNKQLDMALHTSRTTPSHVYGDSSRLQQILLNLLSNACKFTPPGGQITVSLSARTLDQSAPSVVALAKAAAAQALAQGNSPSLSSSASSVAGDGRAGREGAGAASGNSPDSAAGQQLRQRIISATPQPVPTRRLQLSASTSSNTASSESTSSAVLANASSSSFPTAAPAPVITPINTHRGLGVRMPSKSAASSPITTPNAPGTPHTSFTPPHRQYVELHFAVKDTGLGMSEETQSRLFKSFSQGDSSVVRRFGGTGLGLAISKRLALAMHGEMWCESEVGKGSTFHFTIQTACVSPPSQRRTLATTSSLGMDAHSGRGMTEPGPFVLSPLASPSLLPASSASPTSSVANASVAALLPTLHKLNEYELLRLMGKRVLVVSDLLASRDALVHLLSSYDLQVTAVSSMQAAMEWASFVCTAMPHGVLMDYKGCNTSHPHTHAADQLMRAFINNPHILQAKHMQTQHQLGLQLIKDQAAAAAATPPHSTFTFAPVDASSLSSPSASYASTASPASRASWSISAASSVSTASAPSFSRAFVAHPIVLLLTTRTAVVDDDPTAATTVMAFVKPTATVGVVEDDDSAKEEEGGDGTDGTNTEEDESSEGKEDVGAGDSLRGELTAPTSSIATTAASINAAITPSVPSSSTRGPSHEADMINHLVLAKLSNLENHQKRREQRDRDRDSRARPSRKDRERGGERKKRRPHVGGVARHTTRTKLLRHQVALVSPPHAQHADVVDEAAQHLDAAQMDASSSSSLLSADYSLLELTKPYHQSDLLQTLAEHLPDEVGDPPPLHHLRWDSSTRFSSANSTTSMGSEHDWRDDDLDSGGSAGEQRLTREKSDPLRSTPPPPTLSYHHRVRAEGAGASGAGDPVMNADQSGLALMRKASGASSRAVHSYHPHTIEVTHPTPAHHTGGDDAGTESSNGGQQQQQQQRTLQQSPQSSTDSLSTPPNLSPANSPQSPPSRPSSTSLPVSGPRPSSPQVTSGSAHSPPSASITLSSSPPSSSSSSSTTTRSVIRSNSRQSQQRQLITAIAADYPLHLLLAEDNPVNQKMMRMFLKKLGYEVDVANNGEEVLDGWQGRTTRGEQPYDCILMDVNMDGMDGIECTRRLRAEADGARVYIIAQTANANLESKQRCLTAGMNSFLPKPVILEELARQLKQARKALDQWDGGRKE